MLLADARDKEMSELREQLRSSEGNLTAEVSGMTQKFSMEKQCWEKREAEINSQLQSKKTAFNSIQSELAFTTDKMSEVETKFQRLASDFEAFKKIASSKDVENQDSLETRDAEIRLKLIL